MSRQVIAPAAALLGALLAVPAAALNIEFDYSLDDGFFDDPERRASLEQAAAFYEGFADTLTPITVGDGNSWQVAINNPSNLGSFEVLENREVADDTVVIYVGASFFGGSGLGFATTGTIVDITGSADFENAILTRGQENALGPEATDYGIWGGAISFNSTRDWYFGADAAGLGAGQNDFLTTATHEIAHVLGFGSADSWFAQIVENMLGELAFEGPLSSAEFGGPVPLENSAHWLEGTMSLVDGMLQETLMDPSTPSGVRQLPTLLDYAGLADIGWEITPVPAPAAILLLGSSLLSLAARRGRSGTT
ncbi:MAG: PEP-CTERM sorting domain-containing protein [Pseudomonadota bacterium]